MSLTLKPMFREPVFPNVICDLSRRLLHSVLWRSGATEQKLKQMAERVETTDKEQEKFIKNDIEEMKRRYETENEKLWNLETRMDTMSRD